jgi:meiotically up-regulated gene 157 (Mug157) protein
MKSKELSRIKPVRSELDNFINIIYAVESHEKNMS